MSFKAACIQLNNQLDIDQNFVTCERLIREAATAGAQMIFTPEYTLRVTLPSTMGGTIPMSEQFSEDNFPILDKYRYLASELAVVLVLGSMQVRTSECSDKIANRSYVIFPREDRTQIGTIAARYDKIHTFDAVFGTGALQKYFESSFTYNGNKAVVVNTKFGKLGLAICYDIRFPHLFRDLAKNGALFLSIPAAFIAQNGPEHWHAMVKTRAIENGCFVFAAAQCGVHPSTRSTYGHSLIVDPFGTIIAEASEDRIGYIIATIDPSRVEQVRTRQPAIYGDKDYTVHNL